MRVIWCGVSEYDREASIMRRPWPTGGLLRRKIKYGHSHPMLRCVILTTARTGRGLKLDHNVCRWISAMPCRYKSLSLSVYKFRAAQLLLLLLLLYIRALTAFAYPSTGYQLTIRIGAQPTAMLLQMLSNSVRLAIFTTL